jgi:hypothetical protein
MAATRLRRGGEPRATTDSRDDAYIYMLVISLVAMIIGCVFLFLDLDSFQGKPSAPSVPAVQRNPDGGLPGGGATAPQAPGGGGG